MTMVMAADVAGIGAAKDNSQGVVGMAPGARLWAVKVLNSGGTGTLAQIINGIHFVKDHASEVEVTNISIDVNANSPGLKLSN